VSVTSDDRVHGEIPLGGFMAIYIDVYPTLSRPVGQFCSFKGRKSP
jgi:hypothetical protein